MDLCLASRSLKCDRLLQHGLLLLPSAVGRHIPEQDCSFSWGPRLRRHGEHTCHQPTAWEQNHSLDLTVQTHMQQEQDIKMFFIVRNSFLESFVTAAKLTTYRNQSKFLNWNNHTLQYEPLSQILVETTGNILKREKNSLWFVVGIESSIRPKKKKNPNTPHVVGYIIIPNYLLPFLKRIILPHTTDIRHGYGTCFEQWNVNGTDIQPF